MYYWLLSTTGNPEEPKSEESADFLNRVIGSNDPVFSRWAITTVWPQMAVSRPLHCIKINVSYKETHVSAVDPFIVGEINYEDTNE
jgi:hypothetical protein